MDDEQQRRIYELNQHAAQTAHQRYFADAAQLFQSVLDFAHTALKGSAILNGGAAVATLTFMGVLLTAPMTRSLNYEPLVGILTTFGVGVLLSTAASGASYFAQMFYRHSHEERELSWEHPFVRATGQAGHLERTAILFHGLAVLLIFSSYAAFAIGGWQFREFASAAFAFESAMSPDSNPRPSASSEQGIEMSANVNLIVAISSIAATLVGPIVAVVITLMWERVRRSREERQLILQTLLATRGRHADPSYSWAIRTTPLHFASNREVVAAHASYMDAVRLQPTAENVGRADAEIGRRQGILISEMLKALGYRGLTAEQIEGYTAQGLADREELMMRALQALPHIAVSAKRSADAAEELLTRVPKPGPE